MIIKDEKLKKIKKIYHQAYERWSLIEENKLIEFFAKGYSLQNISKKLGRQIGE